MICELRNQHVGQPPRSCKATLDRTRWRGRFNHALTSVAGELRPHVANDLEAVRNVFQLFGDIFAELAQLTAAIGTRVAMKTVADDLSWQMLGQRAWTCFLISSSTEPTVHWRCQPRELLRRSSKTQNPSEEMD
jgi:hypothetical protein